MAGVDGPVQIAQRWITLVLADGDLQQAWPLTDERLRRELVAAWVKANKRDQRVIGHEPDDLIATLSKRDPSRHYLWRGFAETQIEQFQGLWVNVDLRRWVWASEPHARLPGYERVLLTRSKGESTGPAQGDHEITALGFVMRETEDRGWLVAAIAEPGVEDGES